MHKMPLNPLKKLPSPIYHRTDAKVTHQRLLWTVFRTSVRAAASGTLGSLQAFAASRTKGRFREAEVRCAAHEVTRCGTNRTIAVVPDSRPRTPIVLASAEPATRRRSEFPGTGRSLQTQSAGSNTAIRCTRFLGLWCGRGGWLLLSAAAPYGKVQRSSSARKGAPSCTSRQSDWISGRTPFKSMVSRRTARLIDRSGAGSCSGSLRLCRTALLD